MHEACCNSLTLLVHHCDDIKLLFYSGKPPQCNSWVGQCGLYIIVMILEKILMTLLVLFPFWTSVSYLSNYDCTQMASAICRISDNYTYTLILLRFQFIYIHCSKVSALFAELNITTYNFVLLSSVIHCLFLCCRCGSS